MTKANLKTKFPKHSHFTATTTTLTQTSPTPPTPPTSTSTSTSTSATPQPLNVSPAWEYHCMLSHSWGVDSRQRDNHGRVKQLGNHLTARHITCWLDDHEMWGDTLTKMAEGIVKSACIVVAVTQAYSDKVDGTGSTQNHCRRELECAFAKHKHFVFVVMEPEMNERALWSSRLAFALGSGYCHDLSGDESTWDSEIAKLEKSIKAVAGVSTGRAIPSYPLVQTSSSLISPPALVHATSVTPPTTRDAQSSLQQVSPSSSLNPQPCHCDYCNSNSTWKLPQNYHVPFQHQFHTCPPHKHAVKEHQYQHQYHHDVPSFLQSPLFAFWVFLGLLTLFWISWVLSLSYTIHHNAQQHQQHHPSHHHSPITGAQSLSSSLIQQQQHDPQQHNYNHDPYPDYREFDPSSPHHQHRPRAQLHSYHFQSQHNPYFDRSHPSPHQQPNGMYDTQAGLLEAAMLWRMLKQQEQSGCSHTPGNYQTALVGQNYFNSMGSGIHSMVAEDNGNYFPETSHNLLISGHSVQFDSPSVETVMAMRGGSYQAADHQSMSDTHPVRYQQSQPNSNKLNNHNRNHYNLNHEHCNHNFKFNSNNNDDLQKQQTPQSRGLNEHTAAAHKHVTFEPHPVSESSESDDQTGHW